MCVPRKTEPLQPTQTAPGLVDGTTFKKNFSAGLGLGAGAELGRTTVKGLLNVPRGLKKLM